MPLAPFNPTFELDKERIHIYRERLRQARLSFDLSLVITAVSAFVSVVGAVQLLIGHISGGSFTAAAGVSASVFCFRFAKDANDRLDKIASELPDTQTYQQDKAEILAFSESSLQKDWLKPEEDEAWQHL
jgi:hypothetical protein